MRQPAPAVPFPCCPIHLPVLGPTALPASCHIHAHRGSISPRRLSILFSRADTDNDGTIGISEWGHFVVTLLRCTFEKVDKDGNGFLDQREFKALLRMMLGGLLLLFRAIAFP